MIKAEYRRELNRSYMVVKTTVPGISGQYAYRMIRENRIKGLLPCQERVVDGESCLYFDISSRQTLGQFYEGKKLSAVRISRILGSVVQMQQELGEYMLDGESLLLEPGCMFADVETEEFFFCFYPGWKATDHAYAGLADFFLESVDHGAEHAVNLAYQFYKLSKMPGFVLDSFMPLAERECVAETKQDTVVPAEAEPLFSYTAWEEKEGELQQEAVHGDVRKSLLARIREWMGRGRRNRRSSKGNPDRERTQEEEPSLWDIYAERIEERPAGETIYFSDLEKPVLHPAGIPFLVEVEGKRKFSLAELPVTVGKMASRAGVLLEDPSVSRVHARFFSETDDIWLMDMNSRNGTIVNDRKLAPNEAVPLKNGDRVQFGRERFELAFIDSKGE